MAAAVRLGAPLSRAAARPGRAARTPMDRELPAYTPPSSGSTLRSATSAPNRSATRLYTSMSEPGCQLNGRSGSVATCCRVSSDTSPRSAVGIGWDSHQRPGRQWVCSLGPDQRTQPRGPHQLIVEPELRQQCDDLGPPPDERLGTQIDRIPVDLTGVENAAEPLPRSTTTISACGPSSPRNRYAETSPLIPPPTTAILIPTTVIPARDRPSRWSAKPLVTASATR